MAIALYEHNQKAYDAAEAMLSQTGRAAIVHPTGTGKSMIAFRMIEKYPEKRFVWLAPSDYIFQTQLENAQKASPTLACAQTVFITYAKLMLMTEAEMAELRPDIIILDEFHRAGAEHWSGGVERLMAIWPKAWLLGLSATKIRYLDGCRDMASELFDGCIASEMTLGEAVVRGILPAPRYVTTVYQYQKSLEKYQQRIAACRGRYVRERSQQYYDRLRRALENAEGLPAIFERQLTNKTGKYIIFCSSVQHMEELREHIPEWFRGVDDEPHCYCVRSDYLPSSKDFAAFKADDSSHLKLLMCIDMLNEGIHVSGLSGVILFRPTISPIIYKQQIGRALTTGDLSTPLILDVVNNVENLFSVDSIKDEMKEAVFWLRSQGLEREIVAERFDVYDQVQDCRELFGKLEKSLKVEWNEYFEAATAYFHENGDLNIPERYVTAEGLLLGAWIRRQRDIRAGSTPGRLSEEQIRRLDSLGMIWGNVVDQAWEQHYLEAKRYYESHGNLDIPSAYVDRQGFQLGAWIARMRLKYQQINQLDEEERRRLLRLNEIGMIWDCVDFHWETNLACAAQFYAEHGHLLVPANYKTDSGIALGQWLCNLRTARRGNIPGRCLTDKQIRQLDELGMQWGDVKDVRWMKWYDAARRYYQENGDLSMRKDYVTTDGMALGIWLVNQRASRKRNEGTERAMPAERVRLLDEIGMRW